MAGWVLRSVACRGHATEPGKLKVNPATSVASRLRRANGTLASHTIFVEPRVGPGCELPSSDVRALCGRDAADREPRGLAADERDELGERTTMTELNPYAPPTAHEPPVDEQQLDLDETRGRTYAIWSLVLSFASLVLFGPVLGSVAIFLAWRALRRLPSSVMAKLAIALAIVNSLLWVAVWDHIDSKPPPKSVPSAVVPPKPSA